MKREEINIRDPFVLTRNGQYYLYGTRGATCWGPADGFDVYVSRDLENWDGPFECFHNDGTFWADRNYWAPEVHEYHGKLYMLASFKREDLCRGTAILTADGPLGPFVPHSDGRVTPSNWECLDGTLYVSPDDKPYLVFAHEWVQVGDGEICAMPLSSDLSRAIGEPKLLFHASEAEWARLVHHRSSGRDGYVTDGPSMWRTEDGTLLCLWASFSDEGYTEGVAISDNGDITGHFTQVEPLFRRDGGHGMVFRALDGQLYLTLHSPNEHLKEHPCFIPLEEIAGRLTPKYTLPDWFAPLQIRLHKMADELTASLTGWHGSDATFRPEDFGLVPSEKATRAIQSAIDKAGEDGGTVRLSGGDYVSGTLILRSNVRLMVDSGSRLLASTDLADYPEQIARRQTVQDTNMGMNQSLIFAEGCENICICGGGELDGQGTRANFPGDETCHGTPGRPFLMRIIDCRDVHVHDITLRSAACWMENYLNCDRVLLERVTVRNQTNYNNDGIDIDGCRDVIIRSCDVESGDDACCFKGASERNTERVLIENCRLYSCCNALKVGTDTQGDFRNVLVRNCQIGGVEYDPSGLKHRCSDSGVSLEMVDGGTLENFLIENITIDRAWSPFFLRLEDRGRVKPGDPKPPVGTLRRIAISHVRGGDNGARGSYFIGIPEKAIEDVLLHDVVIAQHASEKAVLDEGAISELRGVYPDAHMIDDLGDAPARGLWARHVHGLSLAGYDVIPDKKDARPYLVAKTDVTMDKNACL